MDKPQNTPITDAVYGKKAAHKPKPSARPPRPPRQTTLGEALTPHAAAALVALRAELEAAQPKKRRRRVKPKVSS